LSITTSSEASQFDAHEGEVARIECLVELGERLQWLGSIAERLSASNGLVHDAVVHGDSPPARG
jgi:hypothetical protein